jgi:hypothetical protein
MYEWNVRIKIRHGLILIATQSRSQSSSQKIQAFFPIRLNLVRILAKKLDFFYGPAGRLFPYSHSPVPPASVRFNGAGPAAEVAGFFTLSMFLMLGNMIKHDHFTTDVAPTKISHFPSYYRLSWV